MTKLHIDDTLCIKYIVQIDIDSQYHIVCKNAYESQVCRLLDEYSESFNEFYDNSEAVRAVT